MTLPMATTEDAAAPDMALNIHVAKIATMPKPAPYSSNDGIGKIDQPVEMLPPVLR